MQHDDFVRTSYSLFQSQVTCTPSELTVGQFISSVQSLLQG